MPDGNNRQLALNPELLSYQLLRPRHVGLADVALIGEAYRCWSEVWSETFQELDGNDDLPSDEFTRQDEIGAIFHGYECIALSCFRWVDLGLGMAREDSYFRVWPEHVKDAATRDGSRVCVASHLTVSRPWRGKVSGFSLGKIILALTLDRSQAASEGSAMLGTMRDDNGMGRLIQSMGATKLATAERHGVPVTLIALYRDDARLPIDAKNEAIVRQLHRGFTGAHQ
jgi:hypothetical protein